MLEKKQNDNATLVAEIHAEFNFASDNLLKEANRILKKDLIAEKLFKAGFTSIGRVKAMEQHNDFKRMAETVKHYQEKYPLYKFIAPEQVKSVCKKYNLYCGNVGMYIGDIPDKNIREILKFKLKEEDAPSKETGWVHSSNNQTNFDEILLAEGKWCEKKEEVFLDREKQMSICAPKEMFDMSNSWDNSAIGVKDGFMLVLDPIVLQPVKGGYLVVSKWGLEAGDAEVVNPIEN